MHKRKTLIFLILCLIPCLFIGCTSPSDEEPLPLLAQFAALEEYYFQATGWVTYQGELDDELPLPPLQYVMEGAFSGRTNQLSAEIYYGEAALASPYNLSILQLENTTYLAFAPLFQQILNETYNSNYNMAEAFEETPFLIHPNQERNTFLPNLSALLDTLDEADLEEHLQTDEEGRYILTLTGNRISQSLLEALTNPFALYTDLHSLITDEEETQYLDIFDSLFAGNMGLYILDLIFSQDPDAETYTVDLTLSAPGIMTITTRLIYAPASLSRNNSPQDALEAEEMLKILADYRAAYARAAFLEQSGLEIIFDLPELHMLDHRLDTNLLTLHDIYINGNAHTVSVLGRERDHTTERGERIMSFSWTMVVSYTIIDSFYASETMALFALKDLSIDGFDVEYYQRTPMRINAHDTAAVMALFIEDNHVGRTLLIYVLQTIEDTGQALFLDIVVMLERIGEQDRTILDRLGFHIGVDFLAYLAMAEAMEVPQTTAPEETEED